MDDERIEGRRGFLMSVGRYLLAGLLGGGVLAMTTREGDACDGPDACRACAKFDRCDLPEAVFAREAMREEER